MTIRVQSIAFASLLVASAGGNLADAQTPPQTQTPSTKNHRHSNAIQEVTVTAEKHTGSALTTPIALSVFSAASLKENQINSVQDLQNIDPSININSSGGSGNTVTLRGVTTTDNSTIGEPDVVFNVDGVPYNRNFEQAEGFFDLERVEVLKGPQGTLYGASSTGGAVNVITAPARLNHYDASADFTLGNFNTRRTTVVVNIPVNDSVALRAAANTNYHDGYEVLPSGAPYTGGEDNWSVRLSGLVNFSGDMNLNLQEWFGHVGGDGAGSANYDTVIDNPTGAAQRTVYYNPYPNSENDSFSNLTGQYNWAIGPVHLTYVGGLMFYNPNEKLASTNNPYGNNDTYADYTAGSVPVYDWTDYRGHYTTESNELRLSNQNPGLVDWTVGTNWYHENLYEDDHFWIAAWPTADSYPTMADLTSNVEELDTTFHTTEGIFGQATWHATSKLDLTGGLRQSWDSLTQRGYDATEGLEPPTCVAPNACATLPLYHSEMDNALTYRANATYHFTPTQMAYVTVASGFKAGGFNNFCSGSLPCTYQPEQLTEYELGYKGRPLDNIEFDSDAFYYDYSKMQIQVKQFEAGEIVIYTTDYPAIIMGLENQLIYRPTPADEVRLDVTDMSSRFGNDIPVSGISGHQLGNTPAFAATAGYSHDFVLATGATVRLHGELKYSGWYDELNLNPFVSYKQPAFTRTNVDVRYTSPNGKFYIGAYVQNIENHLQIEEAPIGSATVPGGLPVNVTDPRTFGVTFGVKL